MLNSQDYADGRSATYGVWITIKLIGYAVLTISATNLLSFR